ncbi:MAG: hypothetical protein K8S54_16700 [Spirochaetia bacterium]|nr:hypothetical protein [Spirochaetia bacterium]
MRKSLLCIGTVCLIGFAFSLRADTLYFRDGSTVEGTITAQDQTTIFIQTRQGTQKFAKQQIKRITYGESDTSRIQRETLEKERIARENAARANAQKLQIEKQEAERLKLEREKKDAERKVAEARRQTSSEKGKDLGAIWRAALVPGWGHVYSNRKPGGIVIGSGFALLAGGTWLETNRANQARITYERDAAGRLLLPFLVTADARLAAFGLVLQQNTQNQKEYLTHASRRKTLLRLAAVLYTAQLGHAIYFSTFQQNAHREADSILRVGLVINNDF